MKLAIKIKPSKKPMTDEERIKEMTDMMDGKMPHDEEDGEKEQMLHGAGKNNYEMSKDDAEADDKSVEEMKQEEENETPEDEMSESPEHQALEDKLGIEKHDKERRLFKHHPSVNILIHVGKNRKAA